jgi:hypothetical protein
MMTRYRASLADEAGGTTCSDISLSSFPAAHTRCCATARGRCLGGLGPLSLGDSARGVSGNRIRGSGER